MTEMTELERFIEWVDGFETIAKAGVALGIGDNYIYKIKSGNRAINNSVRWLWFLAGGTPDEFVAPTAHEVEAEQRMIIG